MTVHTFIIHTFKSVIPSESKEYFWRKIMSNYFDKYKRTFNYDIGRMTPMPESPFSFRDDDSFRNLVESIRQYGLLEPIVVIPHREYSGRYEIVSGVRRWMACR